MIKNKCQGCTERHVGCHQDCQSYKEYAAECERVRQNRRKENIYNGYARSCADRAIRIHYNKFGK